MSDTPEEPEGGEEATTELLRLWMDDDETLHCSLWPTSDDPAFWGTVLAHIAGSVAEVLADREGRDAEEALRQIRAAFEEGLGAPPGDAP